MYSEGVEEVVEKGASNVGLARLVFPIRKEGTTIPSRRYRRTGWALTRGGQGILQYRDTEPQTGFPLTKEVRDHEQVVVLSQKTGCNILIEHSEPGPAY